MSLAAQLAGDYFQLRSFDAELALFDAGARVAIKAQAVAGYDRTVAEYRQVVLSAVQDVEATRGQVAGCQLSACREP